MQCGNFALLVKWGYILPTLCGTCCTFVHGVHTLCVLICTCSCSCWKSSEKESMMDLPARFRKLGRGIRQTATTSSSSRKVETVNGAHTVLMALSTYWLTCLTPSHMFTAAMCHNLFFPSIRHFDQQEGEKKAFHQPQLCWWLSWLCW